MGDVASRCLPVADTGVGGVPAPHLLPDNWSRMLMIYVTSRRLADECRWNLSLLL